MDKVSEKSEKTEEQNQERNSTPPIDNSISGEAPYPGELYAWYVVAVLMIVYVFSFMDRQILGLLVGPIKAEFGVGDTAIGLLTGTAFALLYSILGLPIGRLADSKNRVAIIAAGLATWSFFTAACGLAGRFSTLALARVGVGIGEATLSPSAYSLITDYFRPVRQALAISIYGAGIYIGSGLAYVLGGYVVRFVGNAETVDMLIIGTVRSWQSVFFIIGLPGLLFTIVLLSVKEPFRRGLKRTGEAAKAVSVPIREVFNYISSNWRTFLFHNVGFGLCSFISYGSTLWIPTFLNRSYGLPRGDAGIGYGFIVMICGTAGIIFGGYLAGVFMRRGYKDAKMRAALTAALLHIPLGILFPLMPTPLLALECLMGAVFFAAMPFGVGPAAIQEMMPNRMRGQASAIYLLVVNLIGLGLGPVAVGATTEYVFADDSKLNFSLVWVSTAFGVLASILLYLGMRHFRSSLVQLKEWHGRQGSESESDLMQQTTPAGTEAAARPPWLIVSCLFIAAVGAAFLGSAVYLGSLADVPDVVTSHFMVQGYVALIGMAICAVLLFRGSDIGRAACLLSFPILLTWQIVLFGSGKGFGDPSIWYLTAGFAVYGVLAMVVNISSVSSFVSQKAGFQQTV